MREGTYSIVARDPASGEVGVAVQSHWFSVGSVVSWARAIPPGFVRTYGDLSPGAPRFAGTVLSADHDESVPWHRVVRADGTLAKGERQRKLLEEEGVPFNGERVDMRAARLPD